MLALLASLTLMDAAKLTWTIDLDQPTVRVSPDLYGIFFEEINCAGDGGLYAELVRNRSFEDASGPEHWTLTGSGSLQVVPKAKPEAFDRQELEVTTSGTSRIINGGYFGMGLRKGEKYVCRLDLRTPQSVRAELLDEKGEVIADAAIKDGAATLTPNRTTAKGQLAFRIEGSGTTYLDHVSLMPTGGTSPDLRSDLFDLLASLKPAFVRFPGGCWVEGDTMEKALRWKTTIGPAGQRRTQPNLWGYQSTNGLGYHEYLQLCEDLGSDALFVINCGMSHREVVPMDKMDEFVQDALDAIEYAKGDTSTRWGAERAKNGHPRPFNLKYLEIGNENGGPAYDERYSLIYRAVKAKYPEMHLIANLWGGTPKSAPIDILDEHYYSDPSFFLRNATRYDNYDRKGPKIYVGEYAVTQGCGNGNLRGALAEAAFMIGMERNSDIVTMASYAPLFARLEAKAWNPDLIYFDSLNSWGTPSYFVQKLFSVNRPERVVRSELTGAVVESEPFPAGAVGIGTWNTQAEFKDIRVTDGDKVLFESENGEGGRVESGTWDQAKEFIRQTSNAEPSRMIFGQGWPRYTLTLKARRISGAEGFLITVGHKSRDEYLWFNVGGWGNRENAIEVARGGGKSGLGSHKPYQADTGRWIDVRVDYAPDRIRCYLGGVQVFDERPAQMQDVHAIAGVDAAGQPVLKIVNTSKRALDVEIDLRGGQRSYFGSGEVLTHSDDTAENTQSKPNNVVPKGLELGGVSNRFTYHAPPNSLTVIRLRK
ncbi:MAG: hypothetical protein K1X67_13875 [Fimbriimonadaceae bacterium]|nr:hypothetical protein [Fimbriimonadaceae bacterium]